jgi:predicted AAA+ superfamily ATPase
MKRYIFEHLKAWKRQKTRKPLILQGARQVGKTYILKAFGKAEYENVAYLNFESSPQLGKLFAHSLEPHYIIKVLSVELSLNIEPQKTLIIFDEIQECPDALNSLKYFNETANQYHICAAGSLSGVTLADTKGFPVGKVDFLNLYPLTFFEFLQAKQEEKLIDFLQDIQTIEPLPHILHEKALRYFKEYLYVGGMPAAVLEYVQTENFDRVRDLQKNILTAYRLDFAKHAPSNIIMKLNQVWEVIPSQLAKENKKFIYSVIRKGARAQEFEVAIQWLAEAGLIYKIYNTSTPKIPLNAYIDHNIFKIYLVDVGLLGAMADLSAKAIIHGDAIFQEFQGSLTENFAAQSLIAQKYPLYYWTSSGTAELDFLLQMDCNIYPLEVKSGNSLKKKSLVSYLQKYNPSFAIRISPLNLKQDGKILNIPLYLMDRLNFLLHAKVTAEWRSDTHLI